MLDPTSNKLMVVTHWFTLIVLSALRRSDNENMLSTMNYKYVLERFNTSAVNPVKEILLKLNLSDHRILKDGGEVKDYQTRRLLLCCDSTGDLYPVTQQPSSHTLVVLLSFSSTTWHKCLGHPGDDVLRRLELNNLISCRKSMLSALCHACQLGKHVKLPFYSSESSVDSLFEIIHSDIWTSSIPSESGIKYYAIFLDHFSHFVWVYPLHKKSDLFDNFVAFCAYVNKQFNVDIKALQCDHGGEYDNTRFHDLFRQNGIQFRFSCPRTSQQNGKFERMICTINNLICTLLFQAHIPLSY
ncbi:ribonuclease H-like domain-containing protein [Tanacetum coccineum]